tara:strand:+ start:718 stop:936 length:219 start_codon:yes stop_codon:yes gene_type:complete
MSYFNFKHLEEVKENYFRHFLCSVKYSFLFFTCSAFCLFHAVFPFFLAVYASDVAKRIINCSDKRKSGEINE